MRFGLFIFLSFCLSSSILLAQPAAYKNAQAAFINGEFSKAADESTTAYDRISIRNAKARRMKSEMAYMAGYSYQMIFNNAEAERWYQRAIDLRYAKTEPDVHFRIANLQRQQGNYEKAKENYEAYLELVPGDRRTELALEAMNKATFLKDNRTRHTVKNEFKINTNHMEMATSIGDRRGEMLVFGSTRKAPHTKGKDPIVGEPYFNLWQVEMDRNGNWMEPIPFEDGDSINTEYNEGTAAFDGRLRKMFITRCPIKEEQNLGCQIWISERRGRSWGIPTRVNLQPHDSISIGHPTPTPDGMAMIFSGDLPGGEGGMDLWYSEYDRRADTWLDPINLGPEINTPGNELFPTFGLKEDLFFASDGHVGLGGLDIFNSKRTGEGFLSWEAPENMGTPINSDADDFHLTETGPRNGFFSSNRAGSKGARNLPDIWSYELPPSLFDLKVIVTKVGSNERVSGATVEVSSEDETFKGVTNSDGEFVWDKKVDGTRYINEEQDYNVQILPLEGYHENNDVSRFSTKGLEYDQKFIVEMAMLPKTPIVLPEVRYDLGSAVLQVIEGEINSKDSLNYVFNLLQEYDGMVLKLASHTDSRGTAASNEKLAQARAQSCVDYLVEEKGVHPDRLVPVGKGENKPRVIYMLDDERYVLSKPSEGVEYEEIELTEEYINQFKEEDEETFERLHQYNRRTEAEVVRMDWTPPKEEEEEEEEQ